MPKRIVEYRELGYCEVGGCALVTPTTHPVTGAPISDKLVRTSTVERFDPLTGEFETRNSIYRKVDLASEAALNA